MNVLSPFDGMSCGRIALDRANIKVTNYFASEIDKNALKVTDYNYPCNIQLGNVTNITGADLPKIDLLIGGSPCTGFSFAGKQLNFNDLQSKLFFEFVRLLKECKPKYFLLENVIMKQEYRDIISKYLEVEPIMINSNLVSAQNRKRLYWTNIPNVTQPEDKKILLKDIIETDGTPVCLSSSGRGNGIVERRMSNNDKAHTLTRTGYTKRAFSGVITKDLTIRKFSINELKELQTVPLSYEFPVPESKAAQLLGNGWTIDVIAHIFKGLRHEL